MAIALDDVEKRLEKLEAAIGNLQQQLNFAQVPVETQAERGDELIRVARASQKQLEIAWAKVMRELGIEKLQPIGAEQLQEMMAAGGIDPSDNEFSRGIIEMREE